MNPLKMLRYAFRFLSVLCLVGGIACALVVSVCYLLKQGVNDAEYREMVRTCLPTKPENIVWQPWSERGLDQIHVLSGALPMGQIRIMEARYGSASSLFITFGFYQVKALDEHGQLKLLPAYGPNAWTHANWRWPFVLLAAGLVFLLSAKLVKRFG